MTADRRICSDYEVIKSNKLNINAAEVSLIQQRADKLSRICPTTFLGDLLSEVGMVKAISVEKSVNGFEGRTELHVQMAALLNLEVWKNITKFSSDVWIHRRIWFLLVSHRHNALTELYFFKFILLS